jgi:hypothetical protein
MQWLADLFALLGPAGSSANASRSLAEEREMAARIDRFLDQLDHPAGRARTPAEPPAGDCTRVA